MRCGSLGVKFCSRVYRKLPLTLMPTIDPSKLVPEKKAWRVFGNMHDPHQNGLGKSLNAKLTGLLESGDIKVSVVFHHHGMRFPTLMFCLAAEPGYVRSWGTWGDS